MYRDAKSQRVRIAAPVESALESGAPVVALETTVISHGLPHPENLETLRECLEAVISEGAVPAVIGIVAGEPALGLSDAEIEHFAGGKAPDSSRIEKASLNNLGVFVAYRRWAATTVAGSLRVLSMAGLCAGSAKPVVFSTGGIGGVHRGAAETFDVSSDLTALATTPVVCVCSGAKAILDLAKTLETLETLGVPVVGYRTSDFPAFYSQRSGLSLDSVAHTSADAAQAAVQHWRCGGRSAVLVCAPVPEEDGLPLATVERAIEKALTRAQRLGIRGKALTPFLLAQMQLLTGGDTLRANRALLVNNASVAARIAVSLSQMGDKPHVSE
ncbi:MAG TPA: pseudouridine-5'-phosphate glycosidase [Blastocatellia bacterium]|nr:pseudouridine-5'-phosphate glycosidase [Blastocatellia bacterium]